MIKVIQSHQRHHGDFGWLDTHWHFSFDTYYDPQNLNWGALRVFNDDVIRPGQGFGMHPHRDMEIVTYVLEGELEHRDSAGNHGILHSGEVQVMSAGTGIVHSEFNLSKDKNVHLIQLWILPRERGLKPRWEQQRFPLEAKSGKLLPVVSSGDLPATLLIHQDAEIYVAGLEAGQEVLHRSDLGRKGYLFVIEGRLAVNDVALDAGDQARMAQETELRIRPEGPTHFILLDLPEGP